MVHSFLFCCKASVQAVTSERAAHLQANAQPTRISRHSSGNTRRIYKPDFVPPDRDPGFDDHSSQVPVARHPLAANPDLLGSRRSCEVTPTRGPYLALLPMGLAMPAMLPPPRWALTPPFHPYPTVPEANLLFDMQGGLFSVALSVGLPRPGVTRNRALMESGLSSPSFFAK